MELLAFILSTLGTVCVCVSALLKGKNMTLILLLVFLSNALVAASYFLTGATGGAAICCVGAVQTVISFIFERKNKPLPKWLVAVYAAMFVAANLLVFSNVFDVIALVAALMFVMEISAKSGKQYRLWSLANATLWLLYDLLTLSFGPLVAHVTHFTTTLCGIVIHDIKKKPNQA